MDLEDLPIRAPGAVNAAGDINILAKNQRLMGWKAYQLGVAYPNGTPGYSMVAGTPAVNFCYLIPYRTIDGEHRIFIDAWFSHDYVSYNQVSFTGFSLSPLGPGGAAIGANAPNYGFHDSNGMNIYFPGPTYPYSIFTLDAKTGGWPTWAD